MKKMNNRVQATILTIVFIIIVALIILVLPNHLKATSTKNNASPEVLFKNNTSIDLIVYRSSAYVNSSSIDWIQDLKLIPDKELGTVKRTGIKKIIKILMQLN